MPSFLSVSSLQLTMEPCLSSPPVPRNRLGRDSERFSRFLYAPSAKKSEFYHLGLPRVKFCQGRKHIVQRYHAWHPFVGNHEHVIECESALLAPALGCGTRAGVVDQDLPHRLGGDSEEVCAALPLLATPA